MGKENNKALPILTRDNHEDWFRRAQVKIKGKAVWFAVENTKIEHAWIRRVGGAVGEGTSSATTEASSAKERGPDIEGLTTAFEQLGGTWSSERARDWDTADARAVEVMLDGLSSDDAVLIDEYETAGAVWTQLKIKYEKTSITAANTYMTALQTFPYDKKVGIDSSWTKLKEYRRKLVSADGAMKLAYPDTGIFLILTTALRKHQEYEAVLDGLLTQQALSVDEKLKILVEKEAQLKVDNAEEKANAAWRKNPHPYRHPNHGSRRNSDGSDVSMRSTPSRECFCCGATDHFAVDCEYQEASREYARKLRMKKEGSNQPKSSKGHYSKPKNSSSKGKKTSYFKTGNKRATKMTKKKHGHAAAHNSGSDSESGYDLDNESASEQSESEEEEPVEKVMLSKESIRKSTPNTWALDTGASSHMTDQLHLFRDKTMTRTSRVPIQVGGGKLYSTRKGTAKVNAQDGSSGYLENVLYVPTLGVNLISAKKLCKGGLAGSFDEESIWITKGSKRVMQAKQSHGLYVVNHFSKSLSAKPRKDKPEATALLAAEEDALTDVDPDDSEPETAKTKEQRRWYRLMHRRFGHCGPKMLRNLHRVTSLQNAIKVPPPARRVCPPCELAKIRNRTRRELAPHLPDKLELVYLDIAGPFPVSIRANRFFLQIVDSYSRRVWSIPLATKDEAIPAIRKWRKIEELLTDKKVKRARTDNAPELRKVLEQLEREDGLQVQYTTIASSNQNGPVERDIQTAENSMRAMLKAQNLPLEFWDEAVEADSYIRNLQPRGPTINGKITCPSQAYTGKEPNIENIRVWGSKAYAYVNPKTRHKDDRHDKLVLRGREGVFMGYCDGTEKHLKMYAPDLGYTVKSSRLNVDESVPGGDVDLRLRNCESGPQGTPIDLADRKRRGRPRKEAEPAEGDLARPSLPTSILTVEIPSIKEPKGIPRYDEDENGNIREVNQLRQEEPETMGPDLPAQGPENVSEKIVESTKPSDSDLTRPAGEIGNTAQPGNAPQPATLDNDREMGDAETGRYFFRDRLEPKRKRDGDDADENDRKTKMIRSLIATVIAEATREEHALVATQGRIHQGSVTKEIESAFLAVFAKNSEHPGDVAMVGKVVNGIPIPRTYKEAINDSKHAAAWEDAIQEEIRSLVANGTWEEFIAPDGANVVSTKWVFDIKRLVTGETERFKARLVARGFSQQYGVDYVETFSPTVRMDTLRMFLAFVAKEDLECRQYDIKNAFTESHLKEQIFLQPPQGVTVKKGHVLRALRSLYGLKQAGRNWSLLLKEFLIKIGFKQSLADPCLYVHHERGIYLLVYVDDIPAAARERSQLDWFYTELSMRFTAKDLEEIHKILGVRITRDRKNHTIYMDQELYLKTVCDSMGITKGKYKMRTTPAANLESLLASLESETPINAEQYSRGIGQLMYGMVFTRPDIAFTLGRLSQHVKSPVERHGHALKWLLQYIKSTIKQKIRLGPGGAHQDTMGIYTDADWASDKVDRKSISGGAGVFYGGPFGWASKKQTSVATSSAESEYISQAMYAKFGQWAAQVWKDLGVPQYINANQERTVQMYGDNQGALALVKNPHLHERSKHIDISHHYKRDMAEKKLLEITYIPTTDMIADGMTKPLARVAHEKFRRQLGLVDEDTL
jgi:hypothetical protein